ncbi:hypothetical protein DFO70_109259 [Cytobacillus firmus]|uniref:Uncharacterized protein n=2 Tax=Cytobacillus TaxID=2675230 RepID=A0A366JR55_CYTFI|nr:hypothetical protein DFO70_109259 [Cytobacillus firmus]TDX35507.1 hypothetical protein DFO72_1263 [Cytobacillus oceanisediminis]
MKKKTEYILIDTCEECEFYKEAEKIAIELTEHVTFIPTKWVLDQLYQRVHYHYDEKQYVELVLMINQIRADKGIRFGSI